jgi:peptidoglycan-N-acetylglucosamine deacetylase
VPWFWLAVLVVIGGAVLAARTLGRQNGVEPRPAEPTLVATLAPAAAGVATPRPTVGLTSAASRPTSTATRTAVPAVATSTATPLAHATTHDSTGTREVPTAAPVATAPSRDSLAAREVPTVAPVATQPTPLASAAGARAAGLGAVALTFDAGADRGYAEDILDILQEQHLEASFGITGDWARANADLVRRMAADGHLVFNHTLDHRSFTGVSDARGGLSATARRAELDDADAIIAPLIGHSTRPFYRLPYGDDDARVAADVAPTGYSRKIGWTVDSLGWRGTPATDIVARCLRLAAPGAVYVFHVGRASQDTLALPQLIAALRDKGFAFRRVDQN